MAGIGFQLNRMAREQGLGGIANAAINGAFFSSGPWLLAAGAVLLLQNWAAEHLASDGHSKVLTIIVYGFTLSTVISAPFATVGTRMAADSIFSNGQNAVSGIFLSTLTWATLPVALVAGFFFGVVATLSPDEFFFAMAILMLLTHVWIASAFLTAIRRQSPVFLAYFSGFCATAMPILLLPDLAAVSVLAIVALGLVVTLSLICAAIREEFPAPPEWPKKWGTETWRNMQLAATGLVSALAIWVDKWILWFGSDSISTVVDLRVNPINDQASFLGLLTMVPALTLILVTTETRFSLVFETLVRHCTGTASFRRIESARREVASVIMRDMRILVVGQAVLASLCWLLAPAILHALDADPRGIFCFRFTVIGTVFQIVAIYATLVLSYYDLFSRILSVWMVFALASAIATLSSLDAGIASFGWGYMVGALAGATVALGLLAEATNRLAYLLFVGNNPAVVGNARYLA
jgi:polysaccharide biosynthesis protein PelG